MLRVLVPITTSMLAATTLGQASRPVLVEDLCTSPAPVPSFLAETGIVAHGDRLVVKSAPRDGVPSIMLIDARTGEVLSVLRQGLDTAPYTSATPLALFADYSLHRLTLPGFFDRYGIWDETTELLSEVQVDGGPINASLNTGVASDSMYGFGSAGFFRISESGGQRITAAGLTGVANFATLRDRLVALGDSVIFNGESPTGRDPWITDGTTEGTRRLAEFRSFGINMNALSAGNRAFLFRFTAVPELWVTDGTPDGTELVTNSAPMGASNWATGQPPCAVDGRVYWGADSQLWTSDGTPEGTFVAYNFGRTGFLGFSHCVSFAGSLYVQVNQSGFRAIWRTLPEGSGAEALPWLPIAASANQMTLRATTDHLYITLNLPTGIEIWRSDGTEQGTVQLVPDGPTGQFGVMSTPVVANDAIVFMATEPELGQSLFRADGNGLHRLMPLGPLPDRSCGSGATPVGSTAGGLIVRTSDDMLWGLSQPGQPMIPLAQAAPSSQFGVVNGVLIFSGVDAAGAEPWRTDGTPAGTYRLADLYPGSTGSAPGNNNALRGFPTRDGFVYFSANTLAAGRELFRTDGTPEGTGLFADINAGTEASSPCIAVSGERVYAFSHFFSHWRLWTVDGNGNSFTLPHQMAAPHVLVPTDYGVTYLRDQLVGRSNGVFTGTVASSAVSNPDFVIPATPQVATLGSRVLFRTTTNRLAYTDGTVATSGLLTAADAPDRNAVMTGNIAAIGTIAVFGASDSARGAELWRTDGTPEGTVLIADLVPGPDGSHAHIIHAEPGLAIFFATTPDRGRELWRTDGTAEGTIPLPEVIDGPAGFAAIDAPLGIRTGSRVYFSANAGDGQELFVISLCAADFNGDGEPVVADIFSYLSNYFAGNAQPIPLGADVTGDGELASEDIIAFLTLWFNGCP